MVRYSSVRTLLAFAVQEGMVVHQMDVVTAFLNGVLDEDPKDTLKMMKIILCVS